VLSKKITPADIGDFINEVYLLLKKGLSIQDVLVIVQQGQENPTFSHLINTLQSRSHSLKGFIDALAEHPQFFEKFWVDKLKMVVDDTPAFLNSLEKITTYHHRSDFQETDLHHRLQASSLYFILLTGLTFAFFLLMVHFIIPVFADISYGFDRELPLLTQWVTQLYEWVNMTAGMIVILLMIVIIIAWRSPRSNAWIILNLPIFGRLYHQIVLVRFLRSVAYLSDSQQPLDKIIHTAAQSIHNSTYCHLLTQVSQHIAKGANLAEALARYKVFPKKVIHAAIVGTRAEELESIFSHLADIYNKQIQQAIEPSIKVVSLLTTLGIGLVIALLVMAMYLPIFQFGASF